MGLEVGIKYPQNDYVAEDRIALMLGNNGMYGCFHSTSTAH